MSVISILIPISYAASVLIFGAYSIHNVSDILKDEEIVMQPYQKRYKVQEIQDSDNDPT